MSAKLDLKFIDCIDEPDFIKVETEYNVININGICNGYRFIINLDIPTAIKFAKTLRTEINKAKEVENG